MGYPLPHQESALKYLTSQTKPLLKTRLENDVFDIIVDDGSHICHDVISSFEMLYEHLAPGGKYFIEDLHTSYYPDYNGGFRRAGSSIEWLKCLVDGVNFDHIQRGPTLSSGEIEHIASYAGTLAKVSFFDSNLVIEKLHLERLVLYRRVIAGSVAPELLA
jgi:hypothetical protein